MIKKRKGGKGDEVAKGNGKQLADLDDHEEADDRKRPRKEEGDADEEMLNENEIELEEDKDVHDERNYFSMIGDEWTCGNLFSFSKNALTGK